MPIQEIERQLINSRHRVVNAERVHTPRRLEQVPSRIQSSTLRAQCVGEAYTEENKDRRTREAVTCDQALLFLQRNSRVSFRWGRGGGGPDRRLEKLRNQILDLAHEGHQGVVKTKQRLRPKVWWPWMDRGVQHKCRVCHGCQLVSQPSPPELMRRTELPTEPWQDLAADLLGSLPSGEYLFARSR